MKEGAKSIIVLTVICLVVAVALAGVNYVTGPIIEAANAQAAFEACFVVMPQAQSFETVQAEELPEGLPATVSTVYRETTGQGYAIELTTKGYDTGLVILCGIASDGTITGTTVVSSNETPSIGGKCEDKSYAGQYVGKTSALEGVAAISGATYTSNGYKNAVLDAFSAFYALTGGSMSYSEDQLMEMALPGIAEPYELDASVALPEGVQAVLVSSNGCGVVYRAEVEGVRMYLGVDPAGTQTGVSFDDPDGQLSEGFALQSAASDLEQKLVDVKDAILAQAAEVNAAVLAPELEAMLPGAGGFTVVELESDFARDAEFSTEYDGTKQLSARVAAAYESVSGAGYVFLMDCTGQHEGLFVLCGIDASGAISGTEIYFCNETEKMMSGMYEQTYTGQFTGLTELDKSVVLSGATVSSTAYNMAVRCAFEAFASLQEGGSGNE